jgi:uncharacterized protein YkwD
VKAAPAAPRKPTIGISFAQFLRTIGTARLRQCLKEIPMLSKFRLSGLAAALALIALSAYAQDAKEEPKFKPDMEKARDQIFASTNYFRKKEKQGKLKVNADLSKAAQSFAEFMADTDKYGHTADGNEPWDRVAKAGYDYCIVLENIAYEFNSEGFTTEDLSKTLVEAWEKSPPHRKNMLDADVSEIGVGIARSSKTGKFYAVQDYGRPKSALVTFKIANKTNVEIKYAVNGKDFTLAPDYTETHESCRPPEVKFQWPEGAEATKDAKETFRPTAGADYVVRKNSDDKFTVNGP